IGVAADAGRTSICVASGASCPSTFDYGGNTVDGGETISMQNGISIYGGFRSGTTWSRVAGCVTRLTAHTTMGPVCDHPVTSPTAIDGFDLVGGNFATGAAVTVRGSTGAIINDDTITGGSGNSVTTSVGIDVVAVGGISATPIISKSAITGVAAGNGVAIG